jgi:hypothetical protein
VYMVSVVFFVRLRFLRWNKWTSLRFGYGTIVFVCTNDPHCRKTALILLTNELTMSGTSNLTTCPAASSMNATTASFIAGDGAAVFSNTAPIVRSHDTPRFGHVRNITLVMSGSQEEAKSYLVGLLCASFVIFGFFLAWLVLVLIFKCLGKRVGFLSGSSVRLPPSPVVPATVPVLPGGGENDKNGHDASIGSGNSGDANDDQQDANDGQQVPGDDQAVVDIDEKADDVCEQAQDGMPQKISEHELTDSKPGDTELELQKWQKQVKSTERLLRNIRIAVILSGLVIVAMAILMVAYGVKGLNSSVSDGKDGLVQGENLAYSGVELINTYMSHQNATIASAQEVVAGSNETICPQAKEVICSNPDVDCSVFEGYPSFLAAVDQLYAQLTDTKADLNEAAALMNDASEYIDNFTWAFWVATAIVLLYAICTLLILNGIILAWQKKLHGTCWQRTTSRIRGWFIIPLFIFLLILGWIFAMVFVIGSAASGDFCYDSPDANVVGMSSETMLAVPFLHVSHTSPQREQGQV